MHSLVLSVPLTALCGDDMRLCLGSRLSQHAALVGLASAAGTRQTRLR